ncbi:asparagine synthase (glutamine-hydrolyzing) [Thalassotalea atypica]|uniref:asparagine synthase (glutamine-hydrolyzing) n=1 Tax=Thalassotalea atypica TaxID=2054316 RepID=UPI0025732424|nr:asparagine synthase (glutamine-hydrolyzing) [Thalassotalea atypica]
MCGIAGIFSNTSMERQSLRLSSMLSCLEHRGPDSQGQWNNGSLFFGHTRLAIHDLSIEGHQPMLSPEKTHTLVFNGEIYNYHELKQQLSSLKLTFRGDSDTEVLLACLVHWGVEKTLESIDGMFAFAYWSAANNQLFLARDRVGEKPLYWMRREHELVFASEMQAIVASQDRPLDISTDAVNQFLRFSYIPAPYSIYSDVQKLLPGHLLKFDLSQPHFKPESIYYDQKVRIEKDIDCRETASNTLERLLIKSIDERLDADVPVGAFLSGGIDSSLVCALGQKALGRDIDTFTIGFNEKSFDESNFASDVAKHLGCRNHIEIITQQDMLDVVPNMAATYSEPFADSSQLPTYILCKKTRDAVTVALSGDGGDELFGGYSRYQKTLSRWQAVKQKPTIVASCASALSKTFDQTLAMSDHFVGSKEKLRRALRYYGASSLRQLYIDSISFDWQKSACNNHTPALNLVGQDDLNYLMDFDRLQYLPDDILTKVDRASMAHSLEVRVPLLSKDILNFSSRLQPELLSHNQKTKWPLREVLYKYIPQDLIERPKRGFAVPVGQWLRQALKPWAESLINDQHAKDYLPYVDHERYEHYWRQHQRELFDWSGQLWNYIQLLSWVNTVHRPST